MLKKRVAIIGAGPSGLCTAKYMLAEGLEPTIFEVKSDLGGVWNQSQGSTWSDMRTNTSSFNMCFSDHPYNESSPLFLSSYQVSSHLKSYATKYNLRKYIHFNLMVTYVNQLHHKKWFIKWTNLKDETTDNEDIFEYLVICCGTFTQPNVPDIPNVSLFKGIISHVKYYQSLINSMSIRNKRVLVVGMGDSGVQVCEHLIEHGGDHIRVTNIIRRPHWVVSKLVSIDSEHPHSRVPHDFAFYNRKSSEFRKKFQSQGEENRYKNTFLSQLCCEQLKLENKSLFIDPNSEDAPRMSISDNYIRYVQQGKIDVKRNTIISYTKNGVSLNDGTQLQADIVIYSTGYLLDLSFIDPLLLNILEHDQNDLNQPLIMYKNTFHPQIANFACVGLLRELTFSIIELQARWASLVFSDKLALPDAQLFIKGLEEQREYRRLKIKPQFPHPDFTNYADEIAREINALPNITEIEKENPVVAHILSNVQTPAHYRFKEEPQEALKFIEDANRIYKFLLS